MNDNASGSESESQNLKTDFVNKVSLVLSDKNPSAAAYSPLKSLGLIDLSMIDEEDSFNIDVSEAIKYLETHDESESFQNADSIHSNDLEFSHEEKLESLNKAIKERKFNDTLEEMEYILNRSMGKESEITEETRNESPLEFFSASTCSISPGTEERLLKDESSTCLKKRKIKLLKPSTKFDHIESPVACYINKSPSVNYRKGNTPKTTSCISNKHSKNNYKDVLSPVGVYIKNSSSPLIRNFLKMEKENLLLPTSSAKNLEPLKRVVYRPANIKQKVVKDDPKIPKNIGELFVKPVEIIKHDRINGNHDHDEEVNYLENDLTLLQLQNQDVSVLETHKYYINY